MGKRSREEILKELEACERKEVALMTTIKTHKDSNLCEYFAPYAWQKNAREMIAKNNITIAPAPNKIGKTGFGACVVIFWALGYEPWSPVDADFAGAVKVKKRYFKPSSLGKKGAVRVRITGEDWTHHVGQTLVPELKKWAPEGMYSTKKNNQGIEYLWTWKNGSTFEIMTYDQDDKLFEAWLGEGWWADEPPPKAKYVGMARGLFLTGGKALMTMTPLKEAWILDDLILKRRDDIGVLDELTILDNEHLYNSEVRLLAAMGLEGDPVKEYFNLVLYVDDQGVKAEQFLRDHISVDKQEKISSLKVLRFIKDCPIDDKPSRVFGQFKSLVGRVLKKYDKSIHDIDPFYIPTDWPVVPMIDFHLSTPQALSFYAVDPQDRKYVIDEVWDNLSAEELADTIIRKKTANAWNIKEVFIDPLAKGDTQYMKNRAGAVEDSFSIIQKRIFQHKMILMVGSKDKDSGVLNIQACLSGPNKMPTLFFFNNLVRHFFELQRWVWDDDGKPKKENDHFMENLYRFTLTGTKYKKIRPQVSSARSHISSDSNGWMGH